MIQEQLDTAYIHQGWIVIYLFIIRIGLFPVEGVVIVESLMS